MANTTDDDNLYRIFAKTVSEYPSAAAIASGSMTLSYAEVEVKARLVANTLLQHGVKSGDVVGAIFTNTPESLIAILGIAKVGAAFLPIDLKCPSARIEMMLETSGAKFAIHGSDQVLDLNGVVVLALSDCWRTLLDNENWDVVSTANDIAYIIFTSGSSGKPKGVKVSNKAIVKYLRWAVEQFCKHDQGVGAPMITAFGFDASLTSLFAPLISGKTVFFPKHSMEPFKEYVGQHRFSFVKLTPTQLIQFANEIPPDAIANYTETFVIGGETLFDHQIQFIKTHAPNCRIINEYGPTEATVACCACEIDLATTSREGRIPIGFPIVDSKLFILDELMRPVPDGTVGELFIGGECLAEGYSGEPELTAEKFVAGSFDHLSERRLYKSGDLVRMRSDGAIECLGRADDQIKIRGYRVEPGEVQCVLNSISVVRQSVVTARKDSMGGERLIAYIVTSSNEDSIAMIRNYLSKHLPDYMIPSAFVKMTAFPISQNGKIDAVALPDPFTNRKGESWLLQPSTEIETVVAQIWEELLKLQDFGIDENFFELGGHSMLAVQAISRLNRKFAVRIHLSEIFLKPTVRQLARTIQNMIDAS